MNPQPQQTTLSDIGELATIRGLAALLHGRPDVLTGIGDDCAVVRTGPTAQNDLLLTSDAVIENTHFTPQTNPQQVGRKALARALSDIAAMGGAPDWALVDLVAPGHTPVDVVTSLYAGMADLARHHNVAVVGGDTARGPVLELHIFMVGHVPAGTALTRAGAKPGDNLYVTGSLGGSLAGRHLTFEPRLDQGHWLREGHWASALIDLSDGIARDLRHLTTASGTGATIQANRLPLSPACLATATDLHLQHALCDGEDFELLFTVPCQKIQAFEAAWSARFDLACTRIGVITPHPDKILLEQPDGCSVKLPSMDFEHFKSRQENG